MVSYVTMESDPPPVNPTLYGWRRDELSKVLVPIRLPDSIVAAPDGCSRSSPCKTKGCSCASARVACSLMCSCRVDIKNCQNEVKLIVSFNCHRMSINDALCCLFLLRLFQTFCNILKCCDIMHKKVTLFQIKIF